MSANTARQACADPPPSRHAVAFISGERRAEDYLARLQAQQVAPDELALIVAESKPGQIGVVNYEAKRG